MKTRTAKCQVCGVEFQVKPSCKGMYCSYACMGVGSRKTVTVPCENCGKPVTRIPSQIRERTFCSGRCKCYKIGAESKPPVQIEGDIARIPLSKGLWAIVDRSDYESIPELKLNWYAQWNASGQRHYAACRPDSEGKLLLMHRVVMGDPEGMDIDHKDYDGLNNTRSNLRVCTRSENLQNRRKIKTVRGSECTSRYKGVIIGKQGQIYARITINLGRFKTEEEAAKAVNEAYKKFFGEFASLNDLDNDPGQSVPSTKD